MGETSSGNYRKIVVSFSSLELTKMQTRINHFFNEINLIHISAQRGAYNVKLGYDESMKLAHILKGILQFKVEFEKADIQEKMEIYQKVEKYFGYTILDFIEIEE